MSTLRTVSFLAIKDLNRDKRIAALVVCVIAFSFINIAFFSGFMNGLGNVFTDAIVNTATSHIFVTPSEGTNARYINDVSSLRRKIELNPDVVATAPRLTIPASITHGNKEMSVSTIALVPSDEQQVTALSTYITDGSFLSDGADGDIVLGVFVAGEKVENTIGQQTFGTLQRGIGANTGDLVSVKFPNGATKNFRVRGIVTSYGIGTVALQAYITYDAGKEAMGLNDTATSLLVRLDDKNKADMVKQQILQQGVSNVEVRTWTEASSVVSAITATFSVVNVISTIVGIVVVVVTIGIVVFINTARKKRIIGVLKAIGMSSNQIMYIFLLQSLVLGLAGTILGYLMFSAMAYATAVNPIVLSIGALTLYLPTDSAFMIAMTILLSALIAGYIPARFASRQQILETIKTVE